MSATRQAAKRTFRVTEIIALAGLSDFESPLKAANRIHSGKGVFVNEYMKRGMLAEELIYGMLNKSMIYDKISKADVLRTSYTNFDLVGHPDVIALKDNRIYVVDLKLTHKIWNSVPTGYIWQVSLYRYLYKMSYDIDVGTALYVFSPKGFELYEIEPKTFDECEDVIQKAVRFFNLYAQNPNSDEVKKHAQVIEDSFVLKKLKRAKELSNAIKELTTELDEIKDLLKERFDAGDYTIDCNGEQVKFSIKVSNRRVLDATYIASKYDLPDEAYKNITTKSVYVW